MERSLQFGLVLALMVAVFLVFVHPDTIGLNASQDSQQMRTVLLLVFVVLSGVPLLPALLEHRDPAAPPFLAAVPDRLSLICTRLI